MCLTKTARCALLLFPGSPAVRRPVGHCWAQLQATSAWQQARGLPELCAFLLIASGCACCMPCCMPCCSIRGSIMGGSGARPAGYIPGAIPISGAECDEVWTCKWGGNCSTEQHSVAHQAVSVPDSMAKPRPQSCAQDKQAGCCSTRHYSAAKQLRWLLTASDLLLLRAGTAGLTMCWAALKGMACLAPRLACRLEVLLILLCWSAAVASLAKASALLTTSLSSWAH